MARKIEDIEKEVAELSSEQLRHFRAWYEKFDADAWDSQISNDVAAGSLDAIAASAIKEHQEGKTKRI